MKYNKELLENLILNQKLSYEQIGKSYGVSGVAIKKAAIRLGITIVSRRKINQKETFNKGIIKNETFKCLECNKEKVKYANSSSLFCSNKCQQSYQSKQKYIYFLTNPQEIQRANWTLPKSFRRFILEEQNNKCAICGMNNVWNNKPIVFIMDHIDGNAANNKRDNYRAICPNCDSQLDTYKSKNKNGARSYYRYNKQNGGIVGMQG